MRPPGRFFRRGAIALNLARLLLHTRAEKLGLGGTRKLGSLVGFPSWTVWTNAGARACVRAHTASGQSTALALGRFLWLD